jgi:hypothetical protein
MSATVSIPPGDLVTVAAAQLFLGDAEAADTGLLQSIVDAASNAVIDFLGWNPALQTVTEVLSGQGTPFLYPTQTPITAVNSVSLIAGLTGFGVSRSYPLGAGLVGLNAPIPINMEAISFDQKRIYTTTGMRFPFGEENILVNLTGGFATIPPAIAQATLIAVKGMFQAIDVDPNVSGEAYTGVLSRQFWPTGAGALPPAACSLLAPHRKLMLA